MDAWNSMIDEGIENEQSLRDDGHILDLQCRLYDLQKHCWEGSHPEQAARLREIKEIEDELEDN